jgi:hypothetical protein
MPTEDTEEDTSTEAPDTHGKYDAKQTVTYFIRQGTDGPIKIGKTTDLGHRFNRLQVGSAVKLNVLRVLLGDHERALHERFAHLRMHGEWFEPGTDLVEFIAQCDGILDTANSDTVAGVTSAEISIAPMVVPTTGLGYVTDKMRVKYIVNLMLCGKWNPTVSQPAMARANRVPLHWIEEDTKLAWAQFCKLSDDPDTVRPELAGILRKNLLACDAMANDVAKFKAVAAIAKIYAGLVGAAAPTKHQHAVVVSQYDALDPAGKAKMLAEKIEALNEMKEELLLCVDSGSATVDNVIDAECTVTEVTETGSVAEDLDSATVITTPTLNTAANE